MANQKTRLLIQDAIASRKSAQSPSKVSSAEWTRPGYVRLPNGNEIRSENLSNRTPETGESVLAVYSKDKSVFYTESQKKSTVDVVKELVTGEKTALSSIDVVAGIDSFATSSIDVVAGLVTQTEVARTPVIVDTRTIYDSWTDSPWYQYFGTPPGFYLSWKDPAGTPTPGTEFATYSQTIAIPAAGLLQLVGYGVDDTGTVTFAGLTLSMTYPGIGTVSAEKVVVPGNYPLTVSVQDTIAGGAGIGFRIVLKVYG